MTDLTAETQTAHDAGERSRPRLGFLAMNLNSFGVDVAKFFPGVPTNEIYHFTMINGDFREEPQTGEPISFPLTALALADLWAAAQRPSNRSGQSRDQRGHADSQLP